jgi:hypothetical protein
MGLDEHTAHLLDIRATETAQTAPLLRRNTQDSDDDAPPRARSVAAETEEAQLVQRLHLARVGDTIVYEYQPIAGPQQAWSAVTAIVQEKDQLGRHPVTGLPLPQRQDRTVETTDTTHKTASRTSR